MHIRYTVKIKKRLEKNAKFRFYGMNLAYIFHNAQE